MPIGSSKVGVLGAGLVPGGSVTFNASGTWAVPPGVKIVSITGKGATGNPGIAGNPGNPGNPGSGGGGGGSAIYRVPANQPNAATAGREGGAALKLTGPVANGSPGRCTNYNTWGPNAQGSCIYTSGGRAGGGNPIPSGTAGQCGQSGNAGQAGQAGQAGNTGQSSSGLGNTFPGGAGGNAPPGGAAGNAGTGGQGGGGGVYSPTYAGGAAGNGGGAGASGGVYGPTGNIPLLPPGPGNAFISILGGGGAGVVNSGTSGPNGGLCGRVWPVTVPSPPAQVFGTPVNSYLTAGGTGNPQVTSPVNIPTSPIFCASKQAQLNGVIGPIVNTIQGGVGIAPPSVGGTGGYAGWVWKSAPNLGQPNFVTCGRHTLNGPSSSFNNACLRQEVLRAGGGGGGVGAVVPRVPASDNGWGGAGGGGGRGNAGNAGGPSPTVSGTAATPLTFNCVPVTPGTPTPITVGTPGGQIVISWNPQ